MSFDYFKDRTMYAISNHDSLFKAILESLFGEFLEFFFPEARKEFDFSKGFEFLDKELSGVYPAGEGAVGIRYVDKLAKVYLPNGSEEYVLIHIEVQSQKGPNNLEERMYRYYSRIKEKYNVPVEAIAILADSNKNYLPEYYLEEYKHTRLRYDFLTYKIIMQNEQELVRNSNPFALIILAILLEIRNKKTDDDDVKKIIFRLNEEMLKKNIPPAKQRAIYYFIKHFFHFKNYENFVNLERELDAKFLKHSAMNMDEYIIDLARKEGVVIGKEEGKREGKKEGKREGIKEGRIEGIKEGRIEGKREGQKEMLAKLIKKFQEKGMSMSQISELLDLRKEQIELLLK